MSNVGSTGRNPLTGERALRSVIYEVMQQFPKQALSPQEMSVLLPEYNEDAIRAALRGLAKNAVAYPFISRLSRGAYVYDPNRPVSWVTFPAHNKHKKTARAVTNVKAQPVQVEAPQVEAVVKAEGILREATSFVEMLPVFDREHGLRPMDEQVLLRDSDGKFWHAVRV